MNTIATKEGRSVEMFLDSITLLQLPCLLVVKYVWKLLNLSKTSSFWHLEHESYNLAREHLKHEYWDIISFARNNAIYEVQLFKLKQNRSWYCSFSLLTKYSLIAKGKIVKLQRWRKNVDSLIKKPSYPSHVNGNSHCVTGTTTPIATNYY